MVETLKRICVGLGVFAGGFLILIVLAVLFKFAPVVIAIATGLALCYMIGTIIRM